MVAGYSRTLIARLIPSRIAEDLFVAGGRCSVLLGPVPTTPLLGQAPIVDGARPRRRGERPAPAPRACFKCPLIHSHWLRAATWTVAR